MAEDESRLPVRHFCTYGCVAHVHTKILPAHGNRLQGEKFKAHAKKGRLIGYDFTHGTILWIYLPDKDRVVRATSVLFNEDPQDRDEPTTELVVQLEDPEYEVEIKSKVGVQSRRASRDDSCR